jgi:molybdate transport system substrate-binding protein
MKRTVFGIAAVVCGLLLVASPHAGAQAQGDGIRVLISNALKTSLEALRPDAESAVGRPLAMEFNSTAALKMRIQSGERFDATIITAEAIGDLIKKGKLAATPRADVGFSPLVVGIRAGAPRPDLGAIDGLKRTLLSAKSITYPHDGAVKALLEFLSGPRAAAVFKAKGVSR